jgi:predicted RNA-binding Zn ribbon-like protein
MDNVWTALLNSKRRVAHQNETIQDLLDHPEWLEKYICTWHLPVTLPVGQIELRQVKELRSLMSRMVERIVAGGRPEMQDLEALNGFMALGHFYEQIEADEERETYRFESRRVSENLNQALAEIALSFAQTLADGGGKRIRICENTDCQWIFYDNTRNLSKRFCDEKTCGNLVKMRKFRAQQRQQRPGNNATR